jgi:predicted ArsR family transcriptional regulator
LSVPRGSVGAMATDEVKGRTWFERDYPVLRAAAELIEASPHHHVPAREISEATGLEFHAVLNALENLATRHVTTEDWSSLAGRDYVVTGLTADGLVAADVWPSTDVLAERLVLALERLADETPEGSAKQKRLQAAVTSLRDLGVGGASGLLSQAVSVALNLA